MTTKQKARRTSHLKKAVLLRAQQLEPEGEGRRAAAQMVPQWAYERGKCEWPTIKSLADAAGVHRVSLSSLLYADPKRTEHPTRRKMEKYLELTEEIAVPGGMADVLSIITDLSALEES
jgi:hypothetical protein